MNETKLTRQSLLNISTKGFVYVFALFLYLISWFCLWNISQYFLTDFILSALFLPSGLKLAAHVLSARHFLPLYTLGEMGLIAFLIFLLDEPGSTLILLFFSVVGHTLSIAFRNIWKDLDVYWVRIVALCYLVFFYSTICGISLILLSKPLDWEVSYALSGAVSALTGGILLVPFFYLLYDYVFRHAWQPLSPVLINQGVVLRPSAIVWCMFFFCVGMFAELVLLEDMKPQALLIFMLPNIFMAYRYGWQGAVLASVMNSILLATAKHLSGPFDTVLELQSFIFTQAVIGLGLGIGISRQYQLSHKLQIVNKNLQKELKSKNLLAQQLVHLEEGIRKSLARELHDEIGQNITAIQIQSMLAKRLALTPDAKKVAITINDMAMRIHSSTRQLLNQLRPQILDEMGIEEAIRQLVDEMGFKERNISFRLTFGIQEEKLDEVVAVTLYRITQELLNNICKHSGATRVYLTLLPGSQFVLELKDNGIGLPENWRSKGHGLKGVEERIQALGGNISIHSNKNGSQITVKLPIRLNENDQN
ncbi:MASE1 domain-containing sensor histidine kinase [Grimontia sp. NTOU-MAR1]|uniref:MASE1 domain-containing sensor histidine kinase n=1 Tax=Grimontia sp. NTOU-MAR1 TaxID=3111011 RepID=UPI002DBA907A|nr:MASE1 domain-containing protein [Grimontia sp. NTOU-MAR1]WRW00750.1 MASE1 domain-containing protein [Grimontia sp. NTOU-MAR1]